ncbi:2-phospho-L-lactate guanylyltransferase [uncultured Jatrophihabitans sp.]|uniref:2-phospho-L-lactate guanylyltransferase n=1 Tax=uncultured Jatrophihabitans sp. TaxID=1610747 RepID=UPI0035CB2C7A
MRWTVLLPVKALPAAKSRLLPASADSSEHRRLVEAIRADTEAAAHAADGVSRVLLVVDQLPAAVGLPSAEVLVQRAPGLNAALREGAAHAAARWPDDGVAALLGDLPALRPGELASALGAAAGHPRGYVADAAGTGTTLLTSRPGVELQPAFGAGSAARHAAIAAPLAAGPGLRTDVDTAADLAAALALGVGTATAALVGPQITPSSTSPGMMAG